MEVVLGPGHIVLDGDRAPPPKKGAEPHSAVGPSPFSVHVYCGKTTEWIKMAVGMEMGLGPADIVLDGDPAAQKRAQPPPIFGPCPL